MSRGGARAGAGRPRGQGKYGEATKAIRIPLSQLKNVQKLIDSSLVCQNKSASDPIEKIPNTQNLTPFQLSPLPLYGSTVEAGFPSPADDHIADFLDLNTHLVQHPTATFFVRAAGYSMINAGIRPGDILVVDRSLEARHGRVVIAAIDGQLTVKRLHKVRGKISLVAENESFAPIELSDESSAVIWGVVTFVVHKL